MYRTTIAPPRISNASKTLTTFLGCLIACLLSGCQSSDDSISTTTSQATANNMLDDLGTKWTTELILQGTPSQKHLDALSQHYAELSKQAGDPSAEASICEAQVVNYTRIAEAYPNWTELLYRLASQRLVLQRLVPERMEELDQAVVELQHLIAIASTTDSTADEASGYFQLARTYKHQGDTLRTEGQAAATAERYDLAIETFNRVLELRPERIDALGENILIYLARNQVDAAITALQQHAPQVQDTRRKGKLAEMLGALYAETRQNALARQQFRRALELDPKLMGAYLHLAQLEREAGNNQAAIRALQASVSAEPNFIGGYVRLGSMLQQTDQLDEAAGTFERALAVPQSSAVFIGMLPSRALYRNHLYYQAAEQLVYIHESQGRATEALQMAEVAARYQSVEAPLQQAVNRLRASQSAMHTGDSQLALSGKALAAGNIR